MDFFIFSDNTVHFFLSEEAQLKNYFIKIWLMSQKWEQQLISESKKIKLMKTQTLDTSFELA